ncbi:MAG: Translational regulator CsrA [Syntrophus sp. SKADARSKE-3]|nr:Translational regulator CsrA [Syntrophus sp. SKADARSKE-3]
MLILTRKLGETITIGDDIRITLIDVKGKSIRLGIEAPANVTVHRQEVYLAIKEQNLKAASLDNLVIEDLEKHLQSKKSGEI